MNALRLPDGGNVREAMSEDGPRIDDRRSQPDAEQPLLASDAPGGTLHVRSKPPAGTLEKLLGTARAVRELHGGRGDTSAR
jgi:hypothetical protein